MRPDNEPNVSEVKCILWVDKEVPQSVNVYLFEFK